MPDWLSDPRTIILLSAVAVGTVAFGRLRREPIRATAANTVGVVVAWAGLFWAGSLGQEATGALLLASIGIFLMVYGTDRAKAARGTRTAEERG